MWFQKISIPLPRMVLPIRPPHPLKISIPEGSCITPHPPGISYFPFHGLYLPHLEIIDRVPLKINCSHLKTHFLSCLHSTIWMPRTGFQEEETTWWLTIIVSHRYQSYKAIYISYAGRACLIKSSLSFLLVHPAQRARHENRDWYV